MNLKHHNIAGAEVSVEVRLFNSLRPPGLEAAGITLALPAGSTIADALERLGVERHNVFLVLVNGSDITPSLNSPARTDYALQDGDVVAASGPVPYSWGYGAPIV